MSRIKVLQLITGLGPGGAERLVLDMLSRCDPARNEWKLATLADDLRALDVYGLSDVQVNVFNLARGARMRNLIGLRRLVSDYCPHVIHAHMFHSLVAAVAVAMTVRPRPRICFTSHLDPYPAVRGMVVRALKPFRDADVLFYASQHPALNAYRTRVIPNGVHVPLVPPLRAPWRQGGEVRLLAVGRLTDQKDPIGLIRSIAQANIPGVRLDFAGTGPMESELKALVAELGLSERIGFKGMVKDVRCELRRAHIFVMHSKYEGMPMALLEAAAEAMPVLCTPVGFSHEFLRNGRGVVAMPDNFPAALRDLVSNPFGALASGIALHAYVSKFHSIDSTVRQHERLYSDLVRPARSLTECST